MKTLEQIRESIRKIPVAPTMRHDRIKEIFGDLYDRLERMELLVESLKVDALEGLTTEKSKSWDDLETELSDSEKGLD